MGVAGKIFLKIFFGNFEDIFGSLEIFLVTLKIFLVTFTIFQVNLKQNECWIVGWTEKNLLMRPLRFADPTDTDTKSLFGIIKNRLCLWPQQLTPFVWSWGETLNPAPPRCGYHLTSPLYQVTSWQNITPRLQILCSCHINTFPSILFLYTHIVCETYLLVNVRGVQLCPKVSQAMSPTAVFWNYTNISHGKII